MSRRAQQKPSPTERRIVIVGGATHVLDDAFKDFIVECLVPALVEEYIRIHVNNEQKSSQNVEMLCPAEAISQGKTGKELPTEL